MYITLMISNSAMRMISMPGIFFFSIKHKKSFPSKTKLAAIPYAMQIFAWTNQRQRVDKKRTTMRTIDFYQFMLTFILVPIFTCLFKGREAENKTITGIKAWR
jgi:hypothetical protein